MIKGVVVAGTSKQYLAWLEANRRNKSEYLRITDDTYDQARKLPLDTPLYLVGDYKNDAAISMVSRARFKNHIHDYINLGFDAHYRQWIGWNDNGELFEKEVEVNGG